MYVTIAISVSLAYTLITILGAKMWTFYFNNYLHFLAAIPIIFPPCDPILKLLRIAAV